MYDYIIIGASISSLLTATTLKKNILIIEKNIYLGGAWGINCDKYKNMDLVGHIIIPRNNLIGNEIINYFKNNINLELEKINKKDFFFETDKYSKNGKQGDSIIAKYGWVDFFNKILQYVKTFDNIKIIKNIEVLKIICKNKNIILNCSNGNYITNKLVIPMYCNINKIYYNNTYINIPYETIINKHFLIEIKYKFLNIVKKYHAFLDKEPIGLFDRVSVSKIEKNNCILSCRISKKYKNLDENSLKTLIFPFLKKKKILNDSCKINKIYCYSYNCSYRSPEKNRVLLYEECNKLNKIYNNRICILNSIYMGYFLEYFIKNKLNF